MSDESRDLAAEFNARYRIIEEPVMRRIERAMMGSDYGATSYTTSEQADRLADLLDLGPGKLLLDFGRGRGGRGSILPAPPDAMSYSPTCRWRACAGPTAACGTKECEAP